MFRLFTAKPHKAMPTQDVIHETGYQFPIDKGYAAMGMREGWLVYSGYYEREGILHFTYDFVDDLPKV